MHYSAKHGLAIACCLSIRPSVMFVDQDHIGWQSRKLVAETISLTPPLLIAKGHPPTPRETWGNFGETRGGMGK